MVRVNLTLLWFPVVVVLASLQGCSSRRPARRKPSPSREEPATPRSSPAVAGTVKPEGTQPSSVRPRPKRAPHGHWFGGDFDPNASEQVRQLFYETGMNCARMTGGGYGWAADLHKKLADDFQSRGLAVYMQLGSHYPSGDYFKHKEAWLVDQEGETGVEDRKVWAIQYTGSGWPQYSYTAPVLRPHYVKDFTSYVGRFADNRNIAGVILHNEAGYFWNTKRLFDYNPSTIASFRKWLETVHGTVAQLNARWDTDHVSFADVAPPGKPPAKSIGAWLDWRRFQVVAIAEFMDWESGFFKTLRADVPRSTNLDGPLNHWYGWRCADIHAYSKAMDTVGIDIYPTKWTERAFVPYAMDMALGIAQGREVHVLECDVFDPRRWPGFSNEQLEGALRAEVWSFFGHGASCVLAWGFSRGDDHSLTSGEYNGRIRVCRDIAYQCDAIGIRDFHREPSQVALCVDADSYLHHAGVEATPHALTPSLDSEYRGWHAALLDAGIQCDVILATQLQAQLMSKYRTIIMASSILMDAERAGRLGAFVRDGGLLIADGAFAGADRWAHAVGTAPGFGLDELFGVTYAGASRDGAGGATNTPKGTIRGRRAVTGLATRGAKVIGTHADGSPALTDMRHGEGAAVLLGCAPGGAYLRDPGSSALSAWLSARLAQQRVVPRVEVTCDAGAHIDSSVLTDDEGNALLTFVVHGSRGKAAPVARNVSAAFACDDPGAYRAFVFRGMREDETTRWAGPVPAKAVSAAGASPGARVLRIELDDVDSAKPVLLARDTGPLLAVKVPKKRLEGKRVPVVVTCFNPSDARLEVTVTLDSTRSLRTPAPVPLVVEPRRSAQATVRFDAEPGTADEDGRIPVFAVIPAPPGADPVRSVPVDVYVK